MRIDYNIFIRFMLLIVLFFSVNGCTDLIFGASDTAIMAGEEKIKTLEDKLAGMSVDDPGWAGVSSEIEKTKIEQTEMVSSRQSADGNVETAGNLLNIFIPGGSIALGALYSLVQRSRKIKAQISERKYLDATRSMMTAYDETKEEMKNLSKANPMFNDLLERSKKIMKKTHIKYGCERDVEQLLVDMKSSNIKAG